MLVLLLSLTGACLFTAFLLSPRWLTLLLALALNGWGCLYVTAYLGHLIAWLVLCLVGWGVVLVWQTLTRR
jgi:hypothetical protein